MKHTPGPWRVKYEQNVETKDRRGIASCGGYATNDPIESHKVINENKANAHLIAAAPDMYEALNKCLRMLKTGKEDINDDNNETELILTSGDEWVSCMTDIEKVITRAEGKAE